MPTIVTLPSVAFKTNATGAGSTSVIVKLTGYCLYGGTNSTTWWAVGTATEVLETACISGPGNESKQEAVTVSLVVEGLTPSTSYTFYWLAQSLDSAFSMDYTDPCVAASPWATVPTICGTGAVVEIWAA